MFKRLLFYVPLLAIGLIVDFYALAKNMFFDFVYCALAFEIFRQIKLWRLASRVMSAMKAWIDKVTDKDYVLLFGGKKDFSTDFGG